MINKNKRDTGAYYTVIDLNGMLPGEDLNECMKVLCTNKLMLEEMTKIPYNRIVYLFVKKRKSYIVENGCIIIRTTTVYKGRQKGGLRPKGFRVDNTGY